MSEQISKWQRVKYAVNPCDIDRLKILAPVGDALAWGFEKLTAGTECPCCLGVRVVLLTTCAALTGFVIGLVA